MNITICDRCRKEAPDGRLHQWVKVFYGTGRYAFFSKEEENIELCGDCYDEFMKYIEKITPTP